ncbi:MAG: RNA polymerase sigma-70 factor [Draconibacterium sp.]|nr:RNA polymerase sigma-70 factor [Draconibacterium sp.]
MNVLTKIDDKQLVSQLRNNEVKAFDALFHKYSEKLFRFSFSLLKNEEDSKEVVQEAFLRIWKKRQEIDSSKLFKSFLFTISYNLIIDHLRLRLKDQEYREFLAKHFKFEKFDFGSVIDYDVLNGKIKNAVEELPAKRKRVFILSREKGLSHKEIAKELGISVKTVENQINLSLKHLRVRLGKDILPVLFFLFLFV